MRDYRESEGDRNAAVDALNYLSEDEHRSFFAWCENNSYVGHAVSQFGSGDIPVFDYEDWKLGERSATPDHAAFRKDIERTIAQRAHGARSDIILIGQNLAVFNDLHSRAQTGRVALLRPAAVAAFLATTFPAARITPALQRVLTCYLAGLSLGEIASLEGKSSETLKTQTRTLRERLGVQKTEDIGRIVGARIAVALSIVLDAEHSRRNASFERYCERYLPPGSRTMTVLADQGRLHRVIDIGPVTGRPVICLHPLILSDIRPKDVELLERLQLRLIWPLRNGQLGPLDPLLSDKEHLQQACEGVEFIRQAFCSGRAAILSFNTSAKVAIAYALERPAGVSALFLAGVTTADAYKTDNPHRFGAALIGLAVRNRSMVIKTLEYLRRYVLTEDRLSGFFRHHFRDRTADRAVIAQEIHGPFGINRLRDGLINSILSIQHDFGLRHDLDWQRLNALDANIELNFLHGDADVIHSFASVETLVATIPRARLHKLKGAGDLLYHDHLRAVLEPVAERLQQ